MSVANTFEICWVEDGGDVRGERAQGPEPRAAAGERAVPRRERLLRHAVEHLGGLSLRSI